MVNNNERFETLELIKFNGFCIKHLRSTTTKLSVIINVERNSLRELLVRANKQNKKKWFQPQYRLSILRLILSIQ